MSLTVWLLVWVQLESGLGIGRNFWLMQEEVLRSRELLSRDRLVQGWSSLSPDRHRVPVSPHDEYLPQPLDHFNHRNNATYKQRYWVNRDYWERGAGPVFLYIGGEGSLSAFSVLTGEHVDLARRHRALLVSVEHRYYGRSLNPDSLTDKNIQYLSSQQALSDLATFHAFITTTYSLTPNNTWVCFGGSYPGSLSAWFRGKFPHLVYGAVASSAPVRAQLDFTGYNKVVSQSLSDPEVGGSSKCLAQVADAFLRVGRALDEGNASQVERDFRSCGRLAGVRDRATLVGNLADIVMGTVQYNLETSATIAQLCLTLLNASLGNSYQRLQILNQQYMETMGLKCVDNSYENMIKTLRSTKIKPVGVGLRQWYYQTCAEFGYYQTCEDPSCPFSPLLTLQSQVAVCEEVFGISEDSVRRSVDFTNEFYGSDHPKSTHILFVNGNIDPWHALSVTVNQSHSEIAILINGTAHCANMQNAKPEDPASLRQARQEIANQVGKWLHMARQEPVNT